MVPNSDFESQSFNPFPVNGELRNIKLNPNVSYYLEHISSLKTKYCIEVKDQLEILQLNSFNVLHLNIRSMKKKY